jgi:sRNA-binding protein
MFRTTKLALIIGLAGAMAALPSLTAEQKDPDAAGVAEAIRFEKAKQAAADRQARTEEERARAETKTKPRTVKSASAQKAPAPQRNSQ